MLICLEDGRYISKYSVLEALIIIDRYGDQLFHIRIYYRNKDNGISMGHLPITFDKFEEAQEYMNLLVCKV